MFKLQLTAYLCQTSAAFSSCHLSQSDAVVSNLALPLTEEIGLLAPLADGTEARHWLLLAYLVPPQPGWTFLLVLPKVSALHKTHSLTGWLQRYSTHACSSCWTSLCLKSIPIHFYILVPLLERLENQFNTYHKFTIWSSTIVDANRDFHIQYIVLCRIFLINLWTDSRWWREIRIIKH